MITLILLFIVLPMLGITLIHYRTFGRRAESPAHRVFLRYEDIPAHERQYSRRVVTFPSGDNILTGYIHGEDNAKGLIVVAHSFGDGAEGYYNVIKYFVGQGWRVFAYDKTGSHNSGGNGTRGLTQSVLDLDAALTFINGQNWDLPIMLFGHSWGGFAVTAVLNFDHEISAVVSLAGYNRPIPVLQDMSGRILGRAGGLVTPFLWTHQRILFGRNAGLTAVDGINRRNIPVKIIHGREDWLVTYHNAAITAQREAITNPNAMFVSHHLNHNNCHMNLLMSEDAAIYAQYVQEKFMELFTTFAEGVEPCIFTSIHFHHVHMKTNENISRCFCSQVYSQVIPADALEQFYLQIDRHRISELNIQLMDEINEFFKQGLGIFPI